MRLNPAAWFLLLPEKVRNELRTVGYITYPQKINSLHDALDFAFTWQTTPQGSAYWLQIYKHYQENPLTQKIKICIPQNNA